MSKWSEFYQDRLNEVYTNYCREKYKPFIDFIQKEINNLPKHPAFIDIPAVLELGLGLGIVTKILFENNSDDLIYFGGMDNDLEMLNLAKLNLRGYFGIKLIYDDAFLSKQKANIIHSHGLLEHFNNAYIKVLFSNYKGSKHIHYVPSYKYEKPSFGDERLLTPQEWKEITGMNVIEFNDGYDLIITNCK